METAQPQEDTYETRAADVARWCLRNAEVAKMTAKICELRADVMRQLAAAERREGELADSEVLKALRMQEAHIAEREADICERMARTYRAEASRAEAQAASASVRARRYEHVDGDDAP